MTHVTKILSVHDGFGEIIKFSKLNFARGLTNLKSKSIFQTFIVFWKHFNMFDIKWGLKNVFKCLQNACM